MKVSLSTIKQYTTVNEPVETLVARVNAQLGGVEEVRDIGARYKGATIVRVVNAEKHPDADKLKICRIDDGHSVSDIERDADGLVQVVCGAPNVRAGMLVVWLPPGSTVPESFDDKEPFVLSARKLRGVTSYGMLASPKELGLGDSHEGILELAADEWKPTPTPVQPGSSFASAYGLDDTVLDIENKMFTHRPDCFGQLGVAREIAGTAQRRFTSPAWYKAFTEFNSGEGLELSVKNQAYGVVPRLMAVAVQGVSIGPSPLWLQAELVRLGAKPINNVVDVTNYLMLLTGQPTHAYDYDKLCGHRLSARRAEAGEKVTLLNGKNYLLDTADIVIADSEGPIGLGGVMGGQTSEVSADTTNIVIECASFDMYSVRRSSMRHGIFTDAVTRFSKGQSSLQNPAVLGLALAAICDTAGGSQASPVYDQHEGLPSITVVDVTPRFINDRLGLDLTHVELTALLSNVEFVVGGSETLHVTVPFWRTDIECPEDIVEEIGRLYSFDKLPRVLPRRSVRPAPRNPLLDMKQKLRHSLAAAGANEVLTYSFVHERTLTRAKQDPAAAFRLTNALSPELQYYRLSVLPSVLERVRPNSKAGYDEFCLYELGKGHDKTRRDSDNDGLPLERQLLDLVYVSKQPAAGAPFYRASRLVRHIAQTIGLGELVVTQLQPDATDQVAAPFEPSRTAVLTSTSGIRLGIVGELRPEVRVAFKLPDYVAAASLDVNCLLQASALAPRAYRPLSRFPSVAQDISLRVDATLPFAELHAAALKGLDSRQTDHVSVDLSTVSSYAASGAATKTITLRVHVTSYERTLTSADAAILLDAIEAACSKLGAVRA